MPMLSSEVPTAASVPVRAPIFDLLQSLADETRARILLLLESHEFTVGEICQIVQMPQSTVSRHLGILAQDGWLTVRVDGRSRHYRLSPTLDTSAEELWAAVRDELADAPMRREDRLRSRSVLEARAERSSAFFSSEAGRWDQLRHELFGGAADLKLLPGLLRGTELVGDLGCGTGHLSRLLSPFAREVFAIDRSREMLEVARSRLGDCANVQLREGDLTALPLGDGSLDVAIVSLVLHYVVDLDRALAEVHRVLRSGGRILLLDMQRHDREGFREEMGHVWLGFQPEALERLLEEVGFGDVSTVALPPDPDASGPSLFVLRASKC
jgi:ArsR family transcriptional regulator